MHNARDFIRCLFVLWLAPVGKGTSFSLNRETYGNRVMMPVAIISIVYTDALGENDFNSFLACTIGKYGAVWMKHAGSK